MSNFESLTQEFEKAGIPFSCEELLARHTSFRIGGPAAVFCRPKTVEQLVGAIRLCKQQGQRFYLLGKGSNVLFRDQGYDGVVLYTGEMEEKLSVQGNVLTASAGTPLNKVCRAAQQHGLAGMEFAYGIPGSMGGAVYMNAGAYGGEMKDILKTVTFLDPEGSLQTYPVEQLRMGYRTSLFEQSGGCVLSAELALQPGDPEAIKARMEELIGRRREKQPLDYPSAGSTFKRPAGAFAGELIQRCGLRGARVGDAAISEKHCGFVVNLGHATCEDVLALTQKVCDTVRQQTGYELEREIRVVE